MVGSDSHFETQVANDERRLPSVREKPSCPKNPQKVNPFRKRETKGHVRSIRFGLGEFNWISVSVHQVGPKINNCGCPFGFPLKTNPRKGQETGCFFPALHQKNTATVTEKSDRSLAM